VLLDLIDELVASSCTGLAEVQVRYGLVALWTGISCSTASAFLNADWYPAMTEFDHKGREIIS
jgi:hypothetical protein